MPATDPLPTETPAAQDAAAPVPPPFAALSPASAIPQPEPAPSPPGTLAPLADSELERQALQHPGGDGDPTTPE